MIQRLQIATTREISIHPCIVLLRMTIKAIKILMILVCIQTMPVSYQTKMQMNHTC